MSSATDVVFSAKADHDDYDELPEPVKMTLSREEFLWLSDGEKARLIEDFTDPEWG